MEAQDAAATYFLNLWPKIEANKNRIIAGAGIVVFLVVLISFISWRHEANQVAAGEALTQTLISMAPNAQPEQIANAYLGVAAEHPGTPAGTRALLQGAATLFLQGKYTDAQSYFQQFLDSHPNDEFSGQAALGVAKCLEAEGKSDQAAGQYQHVISDFPDSGAVLAAKFALAQINMQQRNYANAIRNFQDVAQSAPYSALGNEAEQYLYDLRSKMPSSPATTAPKTPAGSLNLNH